MKFKLVSFIKTCQSHENKSIKICHEIQIIESTNALQFRMNLITLGLQISRRKPNISIIVICLFAEMVLVQIKIFRIICIY